MKKISEKILHKGNWLSLKENIFINNAGEKINWESIERKNDAIAFGIIAKLIPSNRYVLIKQFRHAINNNFIGLPAGITPTKDISEDELNKCVLKELQEETGYVGKIKEKSPILKVNPGILDSSFFIAFVEINESNLQNKNIQQSLESSEEIKTILIEKKEIKNFLLSEKEKGVDISEGLWFYFCGLKTETGGESMYQNYERNGKTAWVRSNLKSRQKEFCMCWDCKKFNPETEDRGCVIIKNVLAMAADKNIVLPVWECGQFKEK